MSAQIVNTPAGIVVREILASGERAYRLNPLGQWDYSSDHKDRWTRLPGTEVPSHILAVLADYDSRVPVTAV